MAEVLLFHHAQGLTSGVQRVRADAARAPVTPCTCRTCSTGTCSPASRTGWRTPTRSGSTPCSDADSTPWTPLPAELVYAGFSLGVLPAQLLAQTRPGAAGALFYQSCVPTAEFGTPWPAGVPVQIHGMESDPFFAGEGDIDAARALVTEAGTPSSSSTRATSTCSRTAACTRTTPRPRSCSPSAPCAFLAALR